MKSAWRHRVSSENQFCYCGSTSTTNGDVGVAAVRPKSGPYPRCCARRRPPVPLANTIPALACSFSTRGNGLHGAWDDPSMSLSIVTTLVRNLIKVPAAVFRSHLAKDAEVLALRHNNAVLRRQIARVRYEPADRIWLAVLSRLVRGSTGVKPSQSPPPHCCAGTDHSLPGRGLSPTLPPGQTLHRIHRQTAHPAPGSGEQQLGPPPDTRRTRPPRPPYGRSCIPRELAPPRSAPAPPGVNSSPPRPTASSPPTSCTSTPWRSSPCTP